jgi:hypothetical protein
MLFSSIKEIVKKHINLKGREINEKILYYYAMTKLIVRILVSTSHIRKL